MIGAKFLKKYVGDHETKGPPLKVETPLGVLPGKRMLCCPVTFAQSVATSYPLLAAMVPLLKRLKE
jgi:hypothetical protein